MNARFTFEEERKTGLETTFSQNTHPSSTRGSCKNSCWRTFSCSSCRHSSCFSCHRRPSNPANAWASRTRTTGCRRRHRCRHTGRMIPWTTTTAAWWRKTDPRRPLGFAWFAACSCTRAFPWSTAGTSTSGAWGSICASSAPPFPGRWAGRWASGPTGTHWPSSAGTAPTAALCRPALRAGWAPSAPSAAACICACTTFPASWTAPAGETVTIRCDPHYVIIDRNVYIVSVAYYALG